MERKPRWQSRTHRIAMVCLATATLITIGLIMYSMGSGWGQALPHWHSGVVWGSDSGQPARAEAPGVAGASTRSPFAGWGYPALRRRVQPYRAVGHDSVVWPQPVKTITQNIVVVVRADKFHIQVTGESCDVLLEALTRYEAILRLEAAARTTRRVAKLELTAAPPELTALLVSPGRCESWPYPDMDESYHLVIAMSDIASRRPIAELSSKTVWGALRGLETFVQLLTPSGDGLSLLANLTSVEDSPRFPHRGLLLDTSRHFLPVKDIKLEIDAMAAVKLNVFHWHIVDDQSFPWQSVQFPALSERGAYESLKVYTPRDVQEVIEYARLHGIRVIPEFDSPGHTKSWGKGRPGLLAACHDITGKATGEYSNIDPTKPANLRFISKLFREITDTFPDPIIHLGGDEVSPPCWDSDPSVLAYMQNRGMTGNFRQLQFEYLRWLVREVGAMNRTVIVWQEAWENGNFQPQDGILVHVWLGNALPIISRVTAAGFRALLSESWYLDNLDQSWQRMYAMDPQDFPGSEQQLALVSGGEACMWGEMVDSTNVHSRIWPRTAAVAERLWSPAGLKSTKRAAPRLDELVCRLQRRGIPASPANGPGYCPEA